MTLQPADQPQRERGQALVLFALMLVIIIGAAGMLIDGGMAWANRRSAQAAADFAALAAARAIADAGMPCNASGLAIGQAAANRVSQLNGFANVTVEYPASSSQSHKGCSYVLVRVSRSMSTTFSRVYGQTTWQPGAGAVVEMVRTVQSVASCTFCSLNNSAKNHTLMIQLGSNGKPSTLRVDGEIYINSSNGKKPGDQNSCNDPNILDCGKWIVEGDAFDIFGAGGLITAKRIDVVGGWETHSGGIAVADDATCPLAERPTPPQYLLLSPPIAQSNICIHQPVRADPLLAFLAPSYADYTVRSLKQLKATAGTVALQPGIYIGGIAASGTAALALSPGVYYLAGGGLSVTGGASIVGNGVTIYSGSPAGKTGQAGAIKIDTTGSVVLSPPDSGPFGGMTMFFERSSNKGITLNPGNPSQCGTVAGDGQPQGCLGGLAGTIYAPNADALVTVSATGTANLQVIAGKLLVKSGGIARFTYKASGFASTTTTTTLVE